MRNGMLFDIPARYMPGRGVDYIDSRDLASDVSRDVKNGPVLAAFDFTVASIGYLAAAAPKAFKDVGRACHHWNTEFNDLSVGRCIMLAASNPTYNWAPLHRNMAIRVLANDGTRHDLLTDVFRPLIQEIHGLTDRPYAPHDKFFSLNTNLPFAYSTKSLWRDAQAGRFVKAVQKLAPLVNMLVEQEADSVYPLGIGVSGQNMSEVRYQWTNDHIVWPINKAKKSIRNGIRLAIGAHEALFVNGAARIIAANMLAAIADPEAGIGSNAHLPGDLQRLMICRAMLRKGHPLDNRYDQSNYPKVPSNYIERPRVWTANQTMSPTPTEELASPEMFVLTPERIRHERSYALFKRRALEKPKQTDDLVRCL